MFNNVLSKEQNNFILSIGMACCFSLPMIGRFDMYNDFDKHARFSFICFIGIALYLGAICFVVYQNKHHIPVEFHEFINIVAKASLLLFVLLGLYVYCYFFNWKYCPFSEWLMVFYYINFFMIVNIPNKFYDSVHDCNEVIKRTKKHGSQNYIPFI